MEKKWILQNIKKKYIDSLIEIIKKNFNLFIQTLTKRITINFGDNICFEISNTFQPLKTINYTVIIKGELLAFHNFLKKKDNTISSNRGIEAATIKLSENLILTIFENLQSLLLENIPKENYTFIICIHKIIFLYMKLYISEYLQTNYRLKNKEQEQLYESMTTTISRQQEEMLEKEKEQNKRRLDFLINFAHETKLPLTIILNIINMLQEEAGRRKIQSLPILENEINELMNMVIDILDNEKIIQGKMLYNHNVILNISTIVKSKIELFKTATDKVNIQIIPEIQQNLYIKIAPQALDRILNNIIDNAIKYNVPKEGYIYITLQEENNSVFLIVRDTGIGIPADQLNYIFKPYYQSAYKKRNIQGIGAGLPIVKNILNEINAQITIESKLQKGTTVMIKFKKEVIKENTKALIIEQVKLTKPVNKRSITLDHEDYDNNKKTVLVVEDNIELLTFMQNHMNGSFNFYYARDGQEALRKLKIMPKPDVIVADIMMDIMDGYEFYQKLQEIEEMQDIPFIFLTAKTSIEDRLKGLRLGAIDYVEKPFLIPVLIEKIKSLIKACDVYKERQTTILEKKIVKALRIDENSQVNYALLYKKYNLTRREQEIICYVLKGWEIKDIANELCIAATTIRTHIQKIKEKCKVKSKTQLANIFYS